mgnify:CR=1 FL=1
MYQKWSKDQNLLNRLESAAKTSLSVGDALRKCDLIPSGANYKGFKEACRRLGIDISHFLGQAHMRGQKRTNAWKKYTLEEVLVKDSPYLSISTLKRRLVKEGFLKEICATCGVGTQWQ